MTRLPPRAVAAALPAALLATLLPGCPGPAAPSAGPARTGLLVVGSDTMHELGEAWAGALRAAHPDAAIEVRGGGTRAGVAALLDGSADLCLASRELPPAEQELFTRQGLTLWRLEVGRDGVAIAVHASNPVRELSLEQLRGLLSGQLANWEAVGGPPRAVQVVSRETRSGTWEFLNEHVLAPAHLVENAQLVGSSQAVAAAVAREPGAVGYLGLGPAHEARGLQLVALRATPDGPAVLPTPATISDGSYPLARPLWLYARGEPAGLARAYAELAVSPAGQALTRAQGFGGLGPGE